GEETGGDVDVEGAERVRSGVLGRAGEAGTDPPHPGVAEAGGPLPLEGGDLVEEEVAVRAELGEGGGQLRLAATGELLGVVGEVGEVRRDHFAALTARAGDDGDVDTGAGGEREQATRTDRLVVGVGEDGEQPVLGLRRHHHPILAQAAVRPGVRRGAGGPPPWRARSRRGRPCGSGWTPASPRRTRRCRRTRATPRG